MSHITKVEIEVRDLSALITAAENLGLRFMQGQESFKWYGRFVGDTVPPEGVDVASFGRCDHALSLVNGGYNAYEVGIVAQPDGAYGLFWDFYCGGFGLEKAIGANGSRLISEYALCAAESAARTQGWYCERSDNDLLIYHPDGGLIRVDGSGSVDMSGFSGADCVTAAAPVESALGRNSERTLKGDYYVRHQSVVVPHE